MASSSAAGPRSAREQLIGAPLQVKLDRATASTEVQAWLADAVPGLASELGEQSTVTDLLQRWQLLSALGRTDLVLARLLEGHLDALAILAEAGRPAVPGALYGVWASASGGTGLSLSAPSDEGASGAVLSGTMRFCSGAELVDRALVTARDASGALLLFDIGVRTARLRSIPGTWPALGMDASQSLDIKVDDLAVDATAMVGPPGFYLERSGLHLGGVGVAAVWLGGLQGLLDTTLRVLGDRQPDEHGLAHIGAVSVGLESAAATLLIAAQHLGGATVSPDTGLAAVPLAELARIALVCRSSVESAVGVGTHRLPRVVGPVALCRDGDFAHRLADLEVFVRQHHAERDLAMLGAAEFAEPWTDGPAAERGWRFAGKPPGNGTES